MVDPFNIDQCDCEEQSNKFRIIQATITQTLLIVQW